MTTDEELQALIDRAEAGEQEITFSGESLFRKCAVLRERGYLLTKSHKGTITMTFSADYQVQPSMRETVKFLNDVPMRDWRGEVDGWSDVRREEIVRDLNGLIDSAARLRGYLDGRWQQTGVVSDGVHTRAVRFSNNLISKVRKAMGYAQPRSDVRF